MNQFKDVFLGKTERDYTRATTSQKCIRVGGKHNDLENVGHTSRHLTFFEMLGNFSFGDYFKKDAIQFAWEVSTKVFGFEPDRIWPTVFRDDNEAFELWKQYVPESRITRFGEKENFWAMGDVGPCGPCSELLYDRGEKFGQAKNPSEDASGERYLEYWNLVFMQFNRLKDGTTVALPKPSIDTGAGLERVISLKMGVDTLFETDIFKVLIAKISEVSGVPYEIENKQTAPAFRVIADHLRALSFAIADGAQPSNLDRGYVLRKVLRRACRYGRTLGFDEPFLAKILPELVRIMGPDYPELVNAEKRIAEIITLEEESFLKTLKRGGNLLSQIMERAKAHKGIISGEDAFKLKDTYGLPFEEITLLALDGGLSVDETRYHELEKEAKERSRAVRKATDQIGSESLYEPFVKEHGATRFIGYDATQSSGVVTGLIKDGQFVKELHAGDEGVVLVDQSPFYAEMGGQVGDIGTLTGKDVLFAVEDCIAPFKGVIAHEGTLENGSLKIGDKLELAVNAVRRQQIANNHTATHLLHYALHQVLGAHIKQAGSVVDEERLRFDFSHHKALTKEEIRRIEDLVNLKIRENHPVKWYELSYDEVKDKADIKQFFGEKYGSKVRIVETDEAKELCGGTHTSASGTIGYFRIEKESSIAAGVRRIEAVSGVGAEKLAKQTDDQLAKAAATLKVLEPKIQERIEKILEENKSLTAELKRLRQAQLLEVKKQALASQRVLRDVNVIAFEADLEADELRNLAEEIIKEIKTGIVLLGSGKHQKAQLYLRISNDLNAKGLAADAIMRDLSTLIEGSGGGKPQGAMSGGKAYDKIPLAFLKILDYVP
jgi:alanyl-tRNA synthetase